MHRSEDRASDGGNGRRRFPSLAGVLITVGIIAAIVVCALAFD